MPYKADRMRGPWLKIQGLQKKRLGDTILKSPHTYSMREGKSNRKKEWGGNDETHELINKRRDRLSHNVM